VFGHQDNSFKLKRQALGPLRILTILWWLAVVVVEQTQGAVVVRVVF
jgi:hypothetical protein